MLIKHTGQTRPQKIQFLEATFYNDINNHHHRHLNQQWNVRLHQKEAFSREVPPPNGLWGNDAPYGNGTELRWSEVCNSEGPVCRPGIAERMLSLYLVIIIMIVTYLCGVFAKFDNQFEGSVKLWDELIQIVFRFKWQNFWRCWWDEKKKQCHSFMTLIYSYV